MHKVRKMNNSNVLLVAVGSKRIQFGPIRHLPLSVLSLAAWLRDQEQFQGDIQIVDTQIEDPCELDIKNAAVVGISAMTGLQIKLGLEVAAFARRVNPLIKIVWGGIHPSLLPEQTALHQLVDCVVIGEGEKTFSEVVHAVIHGHEIEGIPGTCVQGKNGVVLGDPRPLIDMELLPLPAYDLLDMDQYGGIEKQFDYQSSRGCPFRCRFCYNTVFCNRRYRKKTSEKVIQELFFLQDKYAVKNFGFVDDEFFIDPKRAERIFDAVIKKGGISISASCRLDIVQKFPDSLFKKMRKAGVTRMFFGAESGSDRVLREIRKDITREDIINGSRIVAEAGIRPFLSFMSGFPGENIEDFEDTLDLIIKLWGINPLITVNGIFPFNPYPGTYLYSKSCDLGLIPPDSLEEWGEWLFQYNPNNPWLNKTMKKWMEIAFYIVRFKYYLVRYQDRYPNSLRSWFVKLLTLPMSISANLRMRKRWFSYAWEWKLFAMIVRKTFGFL